MRYNKIRKMDISNGPGVRVSIFVQGCEYNCFNCFNQETHDFESGNEYTDSTCDKILEISDYHYVAGLSVLGGEPLHSRNYDGVLELCKKFRERYPDKSIWLWTGSILTEPFDEKTLEILKYTDVIVDGPYIDSLHDFTLDWRGSSNQRLIDSQASYKLNKIREI